MGCFMWCRERHGCRPCVGGVSSVLARLAPLMGQYQQRLRNVSRKFMKNIFILERYIIYSRMF